MTTYYSVFRFISGIPKPKIDYYGQGAGDTPEEAVEDAIREERDQEKFRDVEEVDYSDVDGFMAVPLNHIHHIEARR